jgi:23S rRNA (cytosine1962-C5)-methyltransferase
MQLTELLISLAPAPETDTTAWRILHDAERGVWVDHFDGKWLVQTREARFPSSLIDWAKGVATSIYWRPRDKSAGTAPELVWGDPVTERFLVKENGASFWIDFGAGYSSGIFLDQRTNRRWVGETIKEGDRFLNTFAYTGGFSVMAAKAGAITTTADLSGTYLDWTWENFAVNQLDPDQHFGIKGDVFEWLASFARKGRQFEGIVLDPPTFSRSKKKKKTFRTDDDYADLAALAVALVAPGGWILCCANTHRLSANHFEKQVRSGIRQQRRDVVSLESTPMPPEFHGDDYLKSLRVVVE